MRDYLEILGAIFIILLFITWMAAISTLLLSHTISRDAWNCTVWDSQKDRCNRYDRIKE